MDSQQPLVETGFTLAWIGTFVGILGITLLSFKAKEQAQNFKSNNGDSPNSHLKKDTLILLISAFGTAISTALYCGFYAIFLVPIRFEIELTQSFCSKVAIRWPGTMWYISRYCFYVFMLWRIQASFREPASLQLSKWTIITFMILIHIWFIIGVCIPLFMSPSFLVPVIGVCGVKIYELFDGFSTADLRTGIFIYDTFLTVYLAVLFVKRLYQLTAQNERVNKYKKKTVILGVIATSTSIIMIIVNQLLPLDKWRYFVSVDCIINLLCVVFTYKLTFLSKINICNIWRNNSKQCNQYDQAKNDESTISKQPNDSVVWNMLVQNNTTDQPQSNDATNDTTNDIIYTDTNTNTTNDITNNNIDNDSNSNPIQRTGTGTETTTTTTTEIEMGSIESNQSGSTQPSAV